MDSTFVWNTTPAPLAGTIPPPGAPDVVPAPDPLPPLEPDPVPPLEPDPVPPMEPQPTFPPVEPDPVPPLEPDPLPGEAAGVAARLRGAAGDPKTEDDIDEALEETFPASDPPAFSSPSVPAGPADDSTE